MSTWLSIWMLAQGGDAPVVPVQQPNPIWGMLVIFLPVMVIWYLLFGLPQSKERSKHDDMLKSLKKNDPVVTIGGIIGTVVNISDSGDEVTLRVDEDTKLRVRRSAIREVIGKEKNEQGT